MAYPGDEIDTEYIQNIHEFCVHSKQLEDLAKKIPSVCSDLSGSEDAYENFSAILDEYQEQPHLLDPHLESLTNILLDQIRNGGNNDDQINLAFKYIHWISKVRGYKHVARLFPHEVPDLEPVLQLLMKQDKNDAEHWQSRYILLLWLSVVCMVPFDMARFDGTRDERPIIERIMDTANMYLTVSDKSRDMAGIVLAKFLSRPDVRDRKLDTFMKTLLQKSKEVDVTLMTGMVELSGYLSVLALIYKHGKRTDVLPYAKAVLDTVISLNLMESSNTLLRKYSIKIIQRIGLAFLKARIASWRYKRGTRTLLNLKETSDKKMDGTPAQTISEDVPVDDEEYDVPEEIEDILEQLLSGLKDKDTVVRWSAAKGVGRVTGRLPLELADEVVDSILRLFNLGEGDGAWHGGCLTLAELGRRGLLLPERLKQVVPVVKKALIYDVKRGSYSVGSHVRDAACYVCWAFARAYEPNDIKPYVTDIASALVIVSVFDREVNCRRAASAAFQENVGRQGTFPHGIDVITAADFFSIGHRVNAYLNVSVNLAQYEEYTIPLIDHLLQTKISHWDIQIRCLTASALHNLTPKAPEHVRNNVLPQLLSQVNSIDVFKRHGSLVAVAEIIFAFHNLAISENKSISQFIDRHVLDELKKTTIQIESSNAFRAVGGDLMRSAVCRLIERISQSKLSYYDDPVIDTWQNLIKDALAYTDSEVRNKAALALHALTAEYYQNKDGSVKDKRDALLQHLFSNFSNDIEHIRSGFIKAVGCLPKLLISDRLSQILNNVIKATLIRKPIDAKLSETRAEAVTALTNIFSTVGVQKFGNIEQCFCLDNIPSAYNALLTALNDYTIDSRGDVGAWVREAAMGAVEVFTSLIVKHDASLLNPETVKKIFNNLLQQASEKIDRTRDIAGRTMLNLLYHEPTIPHIPHFEELKEIFPETDIRFLNWTSASLAFSRTVRTLSLMSYKYHALLGLIVSVGGLTESLVQHSSECLTGYLREIGNNEQKMQDFCQTVLEIYEKNLQNDRVTIPLLNTLEVLLANSSFGLFLDVDDHPFPTKLYSLTRAEISKTHPQKMESAINVFSGLLEFKGKLRRSIMQYMMILLCHRLPWVRKSAADRFYMASLTFDDLIDDEAQAEAMDILTETIWDDDVATLKPPRNRLCELLKIPKPVQKRSATSNKVKARDSTDSVSANTRGNYAASRLT